MSDKLPRFVKKAEQKLEKLEQFWLYDLNDPPKIVAGPIVGDETSVANTRDSYTGKTELSLQAIHNHPDNSFFAVQDWYQFLRESSLKRMVVFGTKQGNMHNPIFVAEKRENSVVGLDFMDHYKGLFEYRRRSVDRQIDLINKYLGVYRLIEKRGLRLSGSLMGEMPENIPYDEYKNNCILLERAFGDQIRLTSHISQIRWIDLKYVGDIIAKDFKCDISIINGEIPDYAPDILNWRQFLDDKIQQRFFLAHYDGDLID